jgi:hypothetical protein
MPVYTNHAKTLNKSRSPLTTEVLTPTTFQLYFAHLHTPAILQELMENEICLHSTAMVLAGHARYERVEAATGRLMGPVK